MNQIIYNSFPRSGNIYAGYVGAHIILGDYATVHIPQIFGTKDLDMVSIFRIPGDAISSLINKKLETGSHKYIDTNSIMAQSKNFCEEYKKYMHHAKENKDNIYIVAFDDFISNPVKHFINIADKFNRVILEDYEESFNSLKFNGKLWEDNYDGHIPREKNQIRLSIDDIVNSFDFIKSINNEYRDFIKQCTTYDKENK